MTLIYNDKRYEVTAESIYCDFGISVGLLSNACDLVEELADMSSYTFNTVEYQNMVVKKRMITIDSDGITVRVILRQKTEAEIQLEQLQALINQQEGGVTDA